MSNRTSATMPTTIATATTPSANKAADAQECAHLQQFKDYLQQLRDGDVSAAANNSANNSASSNELKACQTRNNNETHPISADELPAVLTSTIWTQLQQKHVPRHFRLALLRAIEQECRANANERDFASCAAPDADAAAANNKLLDDAESAAAPPATFVFDLLKLQKFIVNHVEKLLTRLATENMENLNKYHAASQSLCLHGAVGHCHCNAQKEEVTTPQSTAYVVGHIKNKPRKMEDRHVCLERCFGELYQLRDPAVAAYSFYGVFDGHSGALAASYAIAQLPYLLAEQLRRLKTEAHNADAYREAFETAFLLADERFARKRIASGTTAVCALLVHPALAPNDDAAVVETTRLFVAWVGDSKALLVSPAARLQLVKPHQPNSADERKRIERAGGAVIFAHGQWRVNGILNVARSIGDYSLAAAVIAEPDFVDVELSAVHDFLVLGTDGLWDHVAEATIVETVYAALASPEHNALDDIPKRLIELAKQGDSQDNITVVVVFLKERAQIVEHWRSTRAAEKAHDKY